MGRGRRPQNGDRVHSTRLPGLLGRVTDWQPGTQGDAERWLVQPEKRGELATWLTRAEFTFAPEDQGWLR